MFVSDSKYKSLQAACTRRLGSNVLRWPTDKQTHGHAQNGLECTFKDIYHMVYTWQSTMKAHFLGKKENESYKNRSATQLSLFSEQFRSVLNVYTMFFINRPAVMYKQSAVSPSCHAYYNQLVSHEKPIKQLRGVNCKVKTEPPGLGMVI